MKGGARSLTIAAPVQFIVLYRRRIDEVTFPGMAVPLKAEYQRLRELYAQERIRRIWSRHDTPGCCFLLEANSPEAAHEIVDALPLAQAGMIETQIVPIGHFDGFGTLEVKWPWSDREAELAAQKALKSQT